MTPQEHDLIAQLFARLKQTPVQGLDRDAAELIRRQMADQPDAAYKLVQTVLIQDMALNEAQARLAELERQSGGQRGSFLPQTAPRGSVPRTGPWGRGSPQGASMPASPFAASGMAGASSGFLRSAAAMALGVVGGHLLFQGIQSMFGPHAGGLLAGQSLQPSLTESVINPDAAPAGAEAESTLAENEPADAGYEEAAEPDLASNDSWGDDSEFT